jgi:hypothetical protein
MTAEEYEELPAAGAMQCPHCGEMLSLEEVFLHVAKGWLQDNVERQ